MNLIFIQLIRREPFFIKFPQFGRIWDGTWTIERGLACYRESFRDRPAAYYTEESLRYAISNVVAGRYGYATWDAFDQALTHFEEGLALLRSHKRCAKSIIPKTLIDFIHEFNNFSYFK